MHEIYWRITLIIMKFSELSEKSTALNLKYEKGIVSFTYDDLDSKKLYLIKIQCPRYRCCFFSMEPVGLNKCARALIENLSNILGVDKNGNYTLDKKPHNFISPLLSGAIIALGLKAEEYPYLASVRMFEKAITYVAVPVSSEDDITLEILKN